MKRNLWAALLLMLMTAYPASLSSQAKPAAGPVVIDTERSTLTVHVYRSGIFSFAGDNHEIRAPIASGSVDESKRMVELTVNVSQMKVLDPGLDAEKRAQVQEKMLSPEVLDPQRYREITFRSTSVEPGGSDQWLVRGNLTLHGETRPIALPVTRLQRHYRGSTTLKQTDFGMKPIRVGGGTVKVKDEVKIDFEIVTR